MERRVLFVEDDANFREVFTRLMREALAPEQLDVAFVEAGTLAEARTRLREGGLDLVGEINNGGVGDHIPTLVLTGTLETSVAGRAMEVGARGACSKLAAMSETVDALMGLTATQEASE